MNEHEIKYKFIDEIRELIKSSDEELIGNIVAYVYLTADAVGYARGRNEAYEDGIEALDNVQEQIKRILLQ